MTADGYSIVNETDTSRYDIISAIAIIIIANILIAFKLGVVQGNLAGPDCYMHLNRVIHLHETGQWYNQVQDRINPPIGLEQHWTRPFDVLIYAGAWLGSFVWDFKDSLHIWGILVSPFLHIIGIFLIHWALKPILYTEERNYLAIVFASQVGILHAFLIGRPDHQSLLHLFFIPIWGCIIRIAYDKGDEKTPYIMGLLVSLSLWVSLETYFVVIMTFFSLGLIWLFQGKKTLLPLFKFSITIAATMICFLLIEKGAGRFTEELYDQISIVQIYIWLIVSIYLFAFKWSDITNSSFIKRLVISLAGLAFVLTMVWLVFPVFFKGPSEGVDNLYRNTRLPEIAEYKTWLKLSPLNYENFRYNLSELIFRVGPLMLVIPYLIWSFFKGNKNRRYFILIYFVGIIVFLPYGLKQVHWLGYILILTIPPYVMLLIEIMKRGARIIENKQLNLLQPVFKVFLILTFCFWPVALSTAIHIDEENSLSRKGAIRAVCKVLNDESVTGIKKTNVLAFSDFGPEILYRTKHNVMSIPNHRYQSGYTDMYKIYTAADDNVAKEIVKKRGIGFIIVSHYPVEKRMIKVGGGTAEDFFHKIEAGNYPDWLTEIEIPAPGIDEHFRLFRVDLK